MEGKDSKRQRIGANEELLQTNKLAQVLIPDGTKRRAIADTSTESGKSVVGSNRRGKEKANKGLLDFSNGMQELTMLSVTNSALASLEPAPRHDPLNAYRSPYTVMPPGPRSHNALLGLRLERYDGMSEQIYVNVAGAGARVGPPVEIDILNAVVAKVKTTLPDMVNDLTREIQRPLNQKETMRSCKCGSEWHRAMLGKNNSGAVLLLYFPDNTHIDAIERVLLEMTLPDTIHGERPMNICFIDLGAHYTCTCMHEIMTAVKAKNKISLVLVAMCEPTQQKYANVKKSDMTEYTIQVNETLTKLITRTNLTTSTSELLMEKLELFQNATKAAADVIRSQNIELESNKMAMFCSAAATNDVHGLQKVLDMKSEFMRLLDTPGDDSGEGAAGSADPKTPSNAADSDEMPQLFLDLVKMMPEKQYDQMRTRVLSAPLVIKAIDEQVADKVRDVQSDATEEAIKAKVAEALKEKEAQMEARVAEAVKAKQLELAEKVSDIFRKSLVKSRDLFIQVAREENDLVSEKEIETVWNEGFQELENMMKLDFPTFTATFKDNVQTEAAASTAAASAAAASAYDPMDVAGGDGDFWVEGGFF